MLKPLFVLALVASAAHFGHNALFLDTYPGPPWITGPGMVVVAWLIAAAIGVLGYRWHRRGHRTKALLALGAFCASCLLGFGHYFYGPPSPLDLLTNALIVCEGIAGAALLLYVLFDFVRPARP